MAATTPLNTFLTLLLLLTAATVSFGRLVCPPNTQSFITQNRELLPLANVRSTSEYVGFNPSENFVLSRSAWCNSPDQLNFVGQYVELNFTEPVVIALLMSSGFVSSFVNNFTISYSMSASGEEDFQTYGQLKEEQEFTVSGIQTSNANFVLSGQLVARRFRFIIINGTVDLDDPLPLVCWNMLLFGCMMDEAQVLSEGGEATTSPSPSTMATASRAETSSTTSSPCSNQMVVEGGSSSNQTEAEGKSSSDNSMLLLIVVPAVIGIVIIVAIIVGVLVCICCIMSTNHSKSHRSVTIEKVSGHKTRDLDNGTTTPSSSNFHYDNPRFLCYDVPRSIGRQNSVAESISTIGSHAEIKNPAYVTKRSLQALELNGYHLPREESNDYEDVPSPSPTELDKRTVSNTRSNSVSTSVAPPPILTEPPKFPGKAVVMGGSNNNPEVKYSKVNKMKSKQKDEMERDYASPPRDFTSPTIRDYSSPPPPRDYSSPPVINDHYISSEDATAVLAQEIDRLANDLENSRAIVRQW